MATTGIHEKVEFTTFQCPYDRVRHRYQLDTFIRFPSDANAVIDLLTGRLNVRVCPVCAKSLSLQSPLWIAHGEKREVAVAGFPTKVHNAMRATAESTGGMSLTFHASYGQLAVHIAGWTDEYMSEAMAPYLTGSDQDGEDIGLGELHSPLALLVMQEQARGALPLKIVSEPPMPPMPPEREKEFIRGLLGACVSEVLEKTYTYCFHHDGLAHFLDAVTERIPAKCLTEEILRTLVDRCRDLEKDLADDPARISRAFRLEYINAVAHAVAGVVNPRRLVWAQTHRVLFTLSREQLAVVPEHMLMNAQALARTITFPGAWTAAMTDRTKVDELTYRWFEHLGLADRLAEELRAGPIDVKSLGEMDDDELVQEFWTAFHQTQTAVDPDHAVRAHALAGLCGILLRHGRVNAADRLAASELDLLAGSGQWEQLGHTLLRVLNTLNHMAARLAARQMLRRYFSSLEEADLPCFLRFALVNEIGNAYRYEGQPVRALAAYDEAAMVARECPDAGDKEMLALDSNRALVLREIGRAAEAISILHANYDQTPPDTPDKAEAAIRLAKTYYDVNMFQLALTYAQAATLVPLTRTHTPTWVRALLLVAIARAAVEEMPELPELEEALDLSAPMDHLGMVVASAILEVAPDAVIMPRVITHAEEIVSGALDRWDGQTLNSEIATVAGILVEWWLHGGDRKRAGQALAKVWGAARSRDLPWQILWLTARMIPASDTMGRWKTMAVAMKILNMRVPDAGGFDLIASWLVDKTKVQAFALATARAAIQAGQAPASDLINVFEFMTGREIRYMALEGPAAERDDLVTRLTASVPTDQPAALVAFLEDEAELNAVVLSTRDGGCRWARLPVTTSEARRAAATFSRRIGSACVMPRQAHLAAGALTELLAHIGAFLSQHTHPGEHLCLLPSPTLLGLPLHAATLPDGRPLLELNSVSTAPNLTILADMLQSGPTPPLGRGPAGLIVVSKDGDRPEFVRRLHQAGDRITAMLGKTFIDVREQQADKATCLSVIRDCDHLVMLTHGADAGPLHGRGFCVSDGQMLPRAPLPVTAVPELQRFLIHSEDITRLDRAPCLVVSMACSSGLSVAGPGGSRMGLERALFAGGTRTLIAPLWDVDHESALAFLDDFLGRLQKDPSTPSAEHHRRAVLKLRNSYPDLFHWAPFALRGSWL